VLGFCNPEGLNFLQLATCVVWIKGDFPGKTHDVELGMHVFLTSVGFIFFGLGTDVEGNGLNCWTDVVGCITINDDSSTELIGDWFNGVIEINDVKEFVDSNDAKVALDSTTLAHGAHGPSPFILYFSGVNLTTILFKKRND
jgi:hypothetical protein